MERLRSLLEKIDGRGYKAYKEIKGSYSFPGYTLVVDHVQGDPYAAPSRISVNVPSQQVRLPDDLFSTSIRKTALEDYLARCFAGSIKSFVKGRRGTGKSGEVRIETSGQQVLKRNALIIYPHSVEARITVGLPASGRTALAGEAAEIFFKELPRVINDSLFYENLDDLKVRAHVASIEDQEYLRSQLKEKGLVAFVAQDSLLPRRSGIDDRPMEEGALPFKTPESLSFTFRLPNSGEVSGMGIPEGVTLIVGGGFHGKSTLLHAIERGVYNHIPGDGRERVVTNPSAVKVRAEDGRSVWRVDISPFIDNLPFGRDTRAFSTENASGSTSQAANIMEALECGSNLLLIDEDTSATNFMIRDERMQALVACDKEPITPLLQRVKELYEDCRVSCVIVMGGSGDYFSVSDNVIMMDAYAPRVVTGEAHNLAGPDLSKHKVEELPSFKMAGGRRPEPGRLDPSRGGKEVKIDAPDRKTLLYGEHRIDLSCVEQLIDIGQTRSIGLLIHYYARKYEGGTLDVTEGLRQVLREMQDKGLDIISPYKVGTLALPRLFEAAAAVNRIRIKG